MLDVFINILIWTFLTLKKKNLNTLPDKLSIENKVVFLLRDFNVNSLNYNDRQPKNEFLDSIASNYNQLELPATQKPSLIIYFLL